MPVVECTCGMVMSLSTEDSRTYCIRCRRAALRGAGQPDESANLADPATVFRSESYNVLVLVLSGLAPATAVTSGDGSFI